MLDRRGRQILGIGILNSELEVDIENRHFVTLSLNSTVESKK